MERKENLPQWKVLMPANELFPNLLRPPYSILTDSSAIRGKIWWTQEGDKNSFKCRLLCPPPSIGYCLVITVHVVLCIMNWTYSFAQIWRKAIESSKEFISTWTAVIIIKKLKYPFKDTDIDVYSTNNTLDIKAMWMGLFI